jgi:hypothetical protein
MLDNLLDLKVCSCDKTCVPVVDPTPEVSKNAECLVQNTSGTSKKKPVRKKQA